MASWVMTMVASTGYLGIVLLMFAENVFPPIPSELIMPLAGYMATQASLHLGGVIAAGTAGAVLGALPMYYLGRHWGEERIKTFADRHGRWMTVCSDDIDAAKRWFDRHGGAATFLCRLVPGARSLISIPAGIARMRLAVFLGYTAAGSALWSALLACTGFFIGANFEKVGDYLDPVSWAVFGLIVALYLYRVARHKGRRQ
jgi:membrane protein DedA with SNARE-associated domain